MELPDIRKGDNLQVIEGPRAGAVGVAVDWNPFDGAVKVSFLDGTPPEWWDLQKVRRVD